MKLTKNEVVHELIKEYEELKNYDIEVLKQFISNNEFLSNTFLIKTNHPDYPLFITKGHGHKSYGMENEWQVLRFLQNKNVSAPKLILPDHKPQNLLLIEYIESQNAEDLLKANQNPSTLFYKIGQVIGNLHTISVDHVGPFIEKLSQPWVEFQKEKFTEAVTSLKPALDPSLFLEMSKLVSSSVQLLESDNHPNVLIHRDTYFNNFIQDKKGNLFLIDFAMASGGKPLYELAKLYILVLYNYPEQTDNFLKGYSEFQKIQDNFKDLMKLYLLRESLGIIKFAHQKKDETFKQIGITILRELINNYGRILDLINYEKTVPHHR